MSYDFNGNVSLFDGYTGLDVRLRENRNRVRFSWTIVRATRGNSNRSKLNMNKGLKREKARLSTRPFPKIASLKANLPN